MIKIKTRVFSEGIDNNNSDKDGVGIGGCDGSQKLCDWAFDYFTKKSEDSCQLYSKVIFGVGGWTISTFLNAS